MNGITWYIKVVDPGSSLLIDRTGARTVATTDPVKHNVYVSSLLYGDFLTKVFIHELGHCAMISFDLLSDVHKMVKKEYWVEAEEWICNFLAEYGLTIFNIAYSVLGNNAWIVIPKEYENFISRGGISYDRWA